MEAGASIIAFITIAAQSAKIIANVIGGIKDGPENVGRAGRTVGMLQETLGQLAQCRAVTEVGPSHNIAVQIRDCSDDLAAFVSRLRKMQLLDTDSASRRTWKRIKTVFNEKELDKMTVAVAAHSSNLSLWLASQQSISIHNSTQLISQHIDAGFQASSVQLNTVQTKVDGISTNFTNAHLRREQQSSALQTTAQRIETAVDTMQTKTDHQLLSIASTLNESVVTSREEHQSVNSMCSLILDVLRSVQSTMTTKESQDEQTGAILRQLREQTEQTKLQNPSRDNGPNAMSGGPTTGRVLGDVEVLNSIGRLCHLVDHKEGTASAEDVDDIINDLQRVLKAAQELSPTPTGRRSLRRAHGLLCATDKLSINEGVKQRRQLAGQVTRTKFTRTQYSMGNGVLTIYNKRRTFLAGQSTTEGEDDTVDESNTRLVFQLFSQGRHGRTGSMWTANIRLENYQNGTFSSIPRLEVNRILPWNSLVFRLVCQGHLDELRQLLQEGKASLRDHDEDGNSLLFIAAYHCQPEVCRFLISHHADVDVHGFNHFGDMTILNSIFFFGGRQKGTKGHECTRLLLDAGADPTDKSESSASRFGLSLEYNDFESLKLMPGRVPDEFFVGFTNSDSGQIKGDAPLLLTCINAGFGYSEELFSLLIRRGASLSVEDRSGDSCLHLCLRYAGGPSRIDDSFLGDVLRVEKERDALVYLVRQGANVRAKNRVGESVSHAVYSKGFQVGPCGSYRRDLWDAVLVICGYGVREIRGDFRRVGCYVQRKPGFFGLMRGYTKADFRRLWHGWAHLCPYPEDLGDDGDDEFDATDSGNDDIDWDDDDDDDDPSFRCPDPNCDFCARRINQDHDSATEERASSTHPQQSGISAELGDTSTNPAVEPQDSPADIVTHQFEALNISSEVQEDQPGLAGHMQYVWGEEQLAQDTHWEAPVTFSGRWEIPGMDSENPWEDAGSGGVV